MCYCHRWDAHSQPAQDFVFLSSLGCFSSQVWKSTILNHFFLHQEAFQVSGGSPKPNWLTRRSQSEIWWQWLDFWCYSHCPGKCGAGVPRACFASRKGEDHVLGLLGPMSWCFVGLFERLVSLQCTHDIHAYSQTVWVAPSYIVTTVKNTYVGQDYMGLYTWFWAWAKCNPPIWSCITSCHCLLGPQRCSHCLSNTQVCKMTLWLAFWLGSKVSWIWNMIITSPCWREFECLRQAAVTGKVIGKPLFEFLIRLEDLLLPFYLQNSSQEWTNHHGSSSQKM